MMNSKRPNNCLKSTGKNLIIDRLRHLAISPTLTSEIIRSKWRKDNGSSSLKELQRVALSGAPISISTRVSSKNLIIHDSNGNKSAIPPSSSSKNDTYETSSTCSWTAPQCIMWHGFEDEGIEEIGRKCDLCDEDLSCPAISEEAEDYYGLAEEYYDDDRQLPEVSILGCGHCFHSTCLETITDGYLNDPDPPCFLCLSIS